MKILIDTDPGVDDAVALGLILSRKDIDVIGITCVAGNVNVDQTTINMLKILEVYDRKDIPVFKGCSSAILCKNGSYLLFSLIDSVISMFIVTVFIMIIFTMMDT